MINFLSHNEASHSTPERDVLVFIAQRITAISSVREKLEAAVNAEENSTAPVIDMSPYLRPSVQAGHLATQHVESQAQSLAHVVNLQERIEARQSQTPKEPQAPWESEYRPEAGAPKDMDAQSWEQYVKGLAKSDLEIRNDFEKAA